MTSFSSKLFAVFIVLALFVKVSFAQEACGTQISEATAEYLSSHLGDLNQYIQKNADLKNAVNYKFPIQIHVARRADGTGGMTAAEANQSIVGLNADFANAGIEFYQCTAINYINNNDYYNYEQTEEQTITDIYNVEGVINLYYFNQVRVVYNGTLSDVCGYAYFPLGLDHIMLRNSCILSSNTLSHEMGHYFGLLHTHDTRYGEETITRNANDECHNCETAGDQLCDTDADPNLNLLVDINCNYTGTATGTCSGNQYTPQTDNTMAYSTGACSAIFTSQQNSRMSYYAFQRSYTGCISSACPVPSNLGESNITGTSAILSWTAVAGEVAEIRYRIPGLHWNFGGTVTSPLTLSGLSQGYTYEYSIRTRCSDVEVSEWVNDDFVAIQISGSGCYAPNSWGGQSQGDNAYKLIWEVVAGATSYMVRYRLEGTNDAWTLVTANTTNTTLTDLKAGTRYELQMATTCGDDDSGFTGSIYFTTSGDACVDVQVSVFLEGALSDIGNAGQYLNSMRTELNTDLGLLPGQTPTNTISPTTPAGQPYSIAPWSYTGTEGAAWTDREYLDIMQEYGVQAVDWVLLTFRTAIDAASNFKKTAALLTENGTIVFPDRCPLTVADPATFYVLVEHRNHIGALSPTPITVANKVAAHDFTLTNSYGGNGQKEVKPGVWALFAGEGEQNLQGYDINGDDKTRWSIENGNFGVYYFGDFNMNGDTNGSDKNYWSINNGVSSALSR